MTSTFAPPTGPPVTGSPPSAFPETDVVPSAAPSPRGRRTFALAAAAGAAMVLALVALIAFAGGGPDDRADVAEPYSLIAAAENTITARTVEFDLTVSASDLADITVSGAVDNGSQLVSVTTDLSSLLALGDMPVPLGDGNMTVLVDGSTGVLYLDASVLGGFLPDGAGWVSIDLGVLAEQSGQAFDDLQDQFALDPGDIARSLLDSENATEVGVDTIDGVEVRHYEVSVDIAAALAAVPQTELDPGIGDIELPDTITYDVWVTADNQLRRVSFGTEIAGQTIGMQLDMTTSDDPLGIELPADGDVFDLTGLLGF
jgi:hypothetical protein